MFARARKWLADLIRPAAKGGKRSTVSLSSGVPVDDSALTHRSTERHWLRAGGQDANTLIEAQLETQRNRSRYEIRNNGYASGMVSTYANDTIGRDGPRLQVISDDPEFNTELERCVEETFQVIGVQGEPMTQLLLMNIHQLFECGEFLEQELSDPNALTCSTLRLLAIEPDRLGTPFQSFGNDTIRMGVEVDPDTGRPISYHILRNHPGSNLGFTANDFLEPIPAEFMIHGFRRTRPGQARGVPWLAPVLDTFGQLRDYMGDTLLAADIATKFAIMIQSTVDNVTPANLEDEEPIWDIEGGTASFLPNGWEAKAFNPTMPTTQYVDFVISQLREMGRPVGMPYLKLACDASGHNFSSARLDLSNYWVGIQCTRALLEQAKLDRVVRKIQAEGSLSGEIRRPPNTWRMKWIWQPIPQIDPKKEAEAMEIRLRNSATTMAREGALMGEDWESLQTQQQRENEGAAEKDLPLPHAARSAPSQMTTSEEDDAIERMGLNRSLDYLNGGGND